MNYWKCPIRNVGSAHNRLAASELDLKETKGEQWEFVLLDDWVAGRPSPPLVWRAFWQVAGPPSPPCSSFWHPLLPHPPVCLQNSTNLKSTFSTLKLGSHATKTAHNITHISEPFSPPPQMKVCGCRNGRESNGIRCCIQCLQCLQCLQCIVYNGGRRHCLLIWEIAL